MASPWPCRRRFQEGFAYGGTDEYGHHAVDGKVHMHDLHATILHQLGLDHEKLTYRYDGRDFRLTDVHGRVVKKSSRSFPAFRCVSPTKPLW